MDSHRIIVLSSAEQELHRSSFPSEFYRLAVHGWRVVYGIAE